MRLEPECKIFDWDTLREDICVALNDFNDLGHSTIKRIRKASGGTQTAIISLPVEAALCMEEEDVDH